MEKLNELISKRKITWEYNESFEHILNAHKKPELKNIIDTQGVKGCSALNKAGLSQKIMEVLSEESRLESIFNELDESTKEAFIQLTRKPYCSIEEVNDSTIYTLINLGYIYPALNAGETVMMIPEIVKHTYHQINSQEEGTSYIEIDGEMIPIAKSHIPIRSLDGKIVPIQVKKVGRNEPCPCGSGKKYKKCCS